MISRRTRATCSRRPSPDDGDGSRPAGLRPAKKSADSWRQVSRDVLQLFMDMPKSGNDGRVDNLIRAMTSLGLYDLEIGPDDITPASLGSIWPPKNVGSGRLWAVGGKTVADGMRRWWAEAPLSDFEGVRRKFNDAGINIDCFKGSDWVTDEDLNRDFLIAKALGARYLGCPPGLPRIQRMARAAETHNFRIYVHNEDELEDYMLAAMAVFPIVRINFDVGNYTAGGTRITWLSSKSITIASATFT